ncbi:hypothetical protein C8Q75DRAFT_369229 [Abortiporus biennis]|nr:hypothetical protein C8Q75DRAFT_369229 [Abortiporus biennis]
MDVHRYRFKKPLCNIESTILKPLHAGRPTRRAIMYIGTFSQTTYTPRWWSPEKLLSVHSGSVIYLTHSTSMVDIHSMVSSYPPPTGGTHRIDLADRHVLAKQRQSIHESVAQLYAEIENLKRHLYTLTPIGFLPPELLLEIFIFYVADHRNESSTNPSLPPYLWIRLTHVCHHWRNVALGYCLLWDEITITKNPSHCKEMIQRSKEVPLHFTLRPLALVGDAKFEAARPLIDNFRRARTIRCEKFGLYGLQYHHRDRSTAHHLPFLEKLYLSESYSYDQQGNARILFFSEHSELPCLEKVELSRYRDVDILPLLRPTLRHLSLSTIKPHPTHHMLSAVFNSMPSLRTLHLQDALPEREDEISFALDPLSLPLKELFIEDQLLLMESFLRCIVLQPTCAIHISAKGVQLVDLSHEFIQLLSSLASHLSCTTLAPIIDYASQQPPTESLTKLSIHVGIMEITFTAWNYTEGNSRIKLSFDLKRFQYPGPSSPAHVIETVCQKLPLSDVTHLEILESAPDAGGVIGWRCDFSSSDWSKCFGHFTKLKTLVVSASVSQVLPHTLQFLPSVGFAVSHHRSMHHQSLFPDLSEVVISLAGGKTYELNFRQDGPISLHSSLHDTKI